MKHEQANGNEVFMTNENAAACKDCIALSHRALQSRSVNAEISLEGCTFEWVPVLMTSVVSSLELEKGREGGGDGFGHGWYEQNLIQTLRSDWSEARNDTVLVLSHNKSLNLAPFSEMHDRVTRMSSIILHVLIDVT